VKFKSSNSENYNNPFSLDEFTDAISKSHETAVGLDDIHCQMLKRIPVEALLTLLNILNSMWASGKFPSSWCTSTVKPVPKPSKDTSDPSSYRPIALTSCICKVMECMINSRLIWYLELVVPTPGRCFTRYTGFQWGSRSPVNHHIRFWYLRCCGCPGLRGRQYWLYWLTRCGPQPLQHISASW